MKRLTNNLVFACFLLCFVFISGRLSADPVDSTTAKIVAKSFFESKSMLRSSSNEEPAIVRTDKKNDLENYFYVLETSDKHGWLILAGNDDVTPVIAYSDEGGFNQSNGKNENFEYWMDCMKEEINYITGKSTLRSSVQSKAKTEWAQLLSQESTQLKSANASQAADIPRLLGDITWHQSSTFVSKGESLTYNKFTPNNWPAGCVAVAIGQIMKAQLGTRSITGTGSHSDAAPGYGQLSADFANTTYNFADMPDRIWGITLENSYTPTDEYGPLFPVKSSDTEIDAVAQLLYHIGIACDMNYGPSSSSASVVSPYYALPKYFRYQTPQYVIRTDVTDSEWNNDVLTELQAGRPVCYSGQKSTGGHVFVVDGYRGADQKYHINWGWGGYLNGYFALSLADVNLNPILAYKDTQIMIIGLIPNSDDESISVTGVSLNQTTATLIVGDALQLTATVAPANATNQNVTWSSSAPTVASVDANGKVTALAVGTATITVTTEDGNKTAACTVTVNSATPSTVAVTGVSLDQTAATLIAGDILQLTATVAPANATNQNVSWSSSDPAVVIVDNSGLISAVGEGTAIITVTTEDGNKSATCTVTVNPATPSTVAVTGISLDQTTTTLIVGDMLQLTATIAPADATNQNISWSSSAPAVASVDANGKVTALATGTATIAVTTEDGNMTATCIVTVNPATVSVTGVNLDQTIATLIVGNALQLTATVTPANATNKNVTWSSSTPVVASVDATGNITALAAGAATITVTTEDGNKTAACDVQVNSKTGIPELNAETGAYLYNNRLYVKSPVAETIRIYSVNSVLLYNFRKPAGTADYILLKAPGSVLIVKGSSGWVKKVVIKK